MPKQIMAHVVTCHILATCLCPERLPFTLLVFRTLRVGFPSANVYVYGNNLDQLSCNAVNHETQRVGGIFHNIPSLSHGQWIEKLIETQREPFFISDTDVVYFDKVEDWGCELFAGRYEPQFFESWTRSVHQSRIHPSLMLFNPAPLRAAIRGYPGNHEFFSSVNKHLIQWHMVPERTPQGVTMKFYDTCAGLYHALGGTVFNHYQDSAFAHLHCGAYAHLISEHNDLRAVHDSILREPGLAKELTDKQELWYSQHRV